MLKPINIQAGDFTYGQRIELGKILSDTTCTDFQRFVNTFKCLYNIKPKTILISRYLREYERIIQGIQYWVNAEAQLLHYEPTTEEQQAGIDQYHAVVGELATLHAIAAKFSKDPDEVYNWKYSKVFGILLNDLESYKYQQRLNKIYAKKK